MSQQPMKFACWVPEVLGGLAIGDRPQRSGWEVGDHRQLAQIATRIPALKAARVRELERQTVTVNHV